MNSLDYYEREVDAFFSRTVDRDLTPIWDAFLQQVPDGGLILDAGCGSGRDSRQFLQRGYRVSAFDASAAMAEKASAYTGIPVDRRRIEDLTEPGLYDGVWCCAAALHVADAQGGDDAKFPGGLVPKELPRKRMGGRLRTRRR